MKYQLGDTVRVPITPEITKEYLDKSWEYFLYEFTFGLPHPDAPPEYKDVVLTTQEMVDEYNGNNHTKP